MRKEKKEHRRVIKCNIEHKVDDGKVFKGSKLSNGPDFESMDFSA